MVSILALTALLGTARANLCVNESFEIDDDSSDYPDNWGEWSAWISYEGDGSTTYHQDHNMARRGEACIEAFGTDYAFSFQDHDSVVEGKEYYLAAYLKDNYDGGSKLPVRLQLEYRDGPRDTGKKFYTETYLATIPNDGQWHLVQMSYVTPATTELITITIGKGGGAGSFLYDDVWFSDKPFSEGAATDPNPPDGDKSLLPDVDELSWTNPEQVTPAEIITCDVWFTNNFPEYGKYADDPNFTNYADKIIDNEPVESVTLSALEPEVNILADETYYWRVDCYDPNKIDDPENYPVIGFVWTFDTINRAPEVDAGYNQSAWIEGTEAAVTLTGTITDDILPLYVTTTYEWSKISGSGNMIPAGGDSLTGDVPEDGIISTAVTFDAADTYVVQLEGYDTLRTGTDTIKVYVYEESNNGNLVAHWDFENTWEDKVVGRIATPVGGATYDNGDAAYGDYSLLIDAAGEYVNCGGDTNNPRLFATWASPETSEGSEEYSETMTVTCWVKTDGTGFDNWGGIVTKGDTWSLESYDNYGDNDGDVWFRINDMDDVDDETRLEDEDTYVASNGAMPAARTIEDDQWHHIAAVNVGNALHLYIDGILARSKAIDESPIGGHDMWIGRGSWENYPDDDFQFMGRIDEVKLFQAPLNLARVRKDYIDSGGGTSCGSIFEPADLNQDCYVNIEDMALFILKFMDCTDITDPDCI